MTLAYDADAAGQAAAERCYQWEQRFEVQFQVADLPPGRDPADVGRDDPEALVDAVDARDAVPRVPHRPTARDRRPVDRSRARARARSDAAVAGRRTSERSRARPVRHEARGPARHRSRPAARRPLRAPHARPQREPTRPAAAPSADRPVDRRELDALRWAVLAPEMMSGRLDLALFADPVARSAFEALIAMAVARVSGTGATRCRRAAATAGGRRTGDERGAGGGRDARLRQRGRSRGTASADVDAAPRRRTIGRGEDAPRHACA